MAEVPLFASADLVKLAGLRELAADFLVLAGKDRAGRRQWDPVFDAVTEHRQAPRYSSCGDLGHWLLVRIGFRFAWLNREELWGWMVGKNVSLLCAKTAGGANELAHLPVPGERLDAGDVLVVSAHDTDHTHCIVALGPVELTSGARLCSCEYGQWDGQYGRACGKLAVRSVAVNGSSISLSGLPLDSVLSVARLLEASGGEIEPATVRDYLSAVTGCLRVLRRTPRPLTRGNDVRWWAEELVAHKLDPGQPLDVFGGQAEAATRQFRQMHAISHEGDQVEVGPVEWTAMIDFEPGFTLATAEALND